MHSKVLNKHTISASIATDNDHAPKFIKKHVYKDKSRCYECGEEGHMSYECPKSLGPQDYPCPKGLRAVWPKRKEMGLDDKGLGFDNENWASVVNSDQRLLTRGGNGGDTQKMKKAKKASYFCDESGDEDKNLGFWLYLSGVNVRFFKINLVNVCTCV
ncbi:U11/U12 small nuclear ribonucleoprotein 31 kDa protein [Alnus glutinosa]|uniref:U11/U12 small nuclear ribonucleoprotein 31 kDa protein n=1 Tax=Alnus glutinosa TaxID=3517 RepID=UPI002D7A139A|nr:U11/U12 small nuclear ribonucleoprotein 31 kDa protein [Alnus glutinosa]